MRTQFILISAVVVAVTTLFAEMFSRNFYFLFLVFGPLIVMGLIDFFQFQHTIRRNFPLLGRFRYWLELIRPEINQYFIESNKDGMPFSRESRSIVYQRSKLVTDTIPFGTQEDVYEVGYEFVGHSILTSKVDPQSLRVTIGAQRCAKPYSASILNISAMSFGSLSTRAILALNGGAKKGGFAHNTGEGGLSPYHKEPGGDLIWQIGTGYFGARTLDGKFSEEEFVKNASLDQVKMIEIKLSQGAKPGHGGVLPGEKVTAEIAAIRGVPVGKTVYSPSSHSAFEDPKGLLEWITRLRELSGGKPVGIKFCLGRKFQFIALCKAMLKYQMFPDYIAVDGGGGGTGAAPLEFSNRIGMPGLESLIYVHDTLVGFGIREELKIMCSGKVTTGFAIVQRCCLGADLLYSARGMMMSLGCIQALRCNTNDCPTGVATQDPSLVQGLHVSSKSERVKNFHKETVASVAHMLEAMGLQHSDDLRPYHLNRRVETAVIKNYSEIYDFLQPGELLDEENLPLRYKAAYAASQADSFLRQGG